MSPPRSRTGQRPRLEPLERRDLLTLLLTASNITVTSEPYHGPVASVLDTNLGDTPASFSSVAINWGDGSPVDTQSGTVVATAFPGVFQVDGQHSYAKSGPFLTQITVTDKNGQTAQSSGTAVVTAVPLTIEPNAVKGLAGSPLSAQNGNKPVTVAVFLDPNLNDAASSFNAIINWGDGHSSPGTVTGGGGVFTVTGDNTYSAAGSYHFAVTVVGNGATSDTTGQATIRSTSAGISVLGQQIVQPAGQPLVNEPVATFTDSNTSDTPGILSALINWGDGGTGAGSITEHNGVFTVSGSYTYAVPGVYQIAVTIQNQSGQTGMGTSTANIVNTGTPGGSFAFTIGLAPLPGNGPAAASGLTNTDRPTFSGTAPPFAIVQVTANRVGVDAPLGLGQAIADGAGQWTLATGPLADGTYYVTATVTPPGGAPEQLTNPPGSANPFDQFVIDTAPPRRHHRPMHPPPKHVRHRVAAHGRH